MKSGWMVGLLAAGLCWMAPAGLKAQNDGLDELVKTADEGKTPPKEVKTAPAEKTAAKEGKEGNGRGRGGRDPEALLAQLQEISPEAKAALDELKALDNQLYMQKLFGLMRQVPHWKELKQNDEAEFKVEIDILLQDIAVSKLVKQITAAKEPKEAEAATGQLKALLEKQFDSLITRMNSDLMKKEDDTLRNKMEEFKKNKETIVKQHLDDRGGMPLTIGAPIGRGNRGENKTADAKTGEAKTKDAPKTGDAPKTEDVPPPPAPGGAFGN